MWTCTGFLGQRMVASSVAANVVVRALRGGLPPLLQIVLVVAFGGMPHSSFLNHRHNGSGRQPLLLLGLGRQRLLHLLGAVREDAGPVLRAGVVPLPVQSGGIVPLPEDGQQLLVTDHRGVERYLDCLCVPASAAGNISVRWVCGVAVGVTHCCIGDTGKTLE